MPVLEAMALGVPVLAATGSSLDEVTGDAAILVDPDDHRLLAYELRTALRDDRLRRELAERGQIRAQAFTWARAAAETRTMLEKTLA
jgi:glycosyltransferase involved in cell wall biosynthesis